MASTGGGGPTITRNNFTFRARRLTHETHRLMSEKALYMKTKAKSLTLFDVFVTYACALCSLSQLLKECTTVSHCVSNQAKYSLLTLLIISTFVSSTFFYRPLFLIPSICPVFYFPVQNLQKWQYMHACTHFVLYI